MNHDGAQTQTKSPAGPDSSRQGVSDEQKRNAVQYVRIFWLLAIATLLSSNLVLPWKLVPIALGTAAVVVGIIALVKAARARMRPVLPVLISIGLVVTFVTTLGMAAMALLWDRTVTYESCMRSAITLNATESCQSEYLSFDLP